MSLKAEGNNTKQGDKVEQFIYNSNGPFDVVTCSSTTGVSNNTVQKYLKNFEKQGLVKMIHLGQQKIYTRMKVESDVKHKIKNDKLRIPDDVIKEYELFYHMASTGFIL